MNADFHVGLIRIETDRLILRAFDQSDLSDLFEYASVKGVFEMAGWKSHEDIRQTQDLLNNFILEDNTFALVLKENNKVIGSLGIRKYGLEDVLTEFHGYLGCEIGYDLSKEYWGRGLMPEALRGVCDYLFNKAGFDFILCGYFGYNTQSKRVQEKCGFKPYRKLVFDTQIGTKENGILSLILNPNKNIKLIFSHPETLICIPDDFVNPTRVTEELSAMAVVVLGDKILATNELIYGVERLSLPKGHKEEGETLVETAIRECFEETNIVITNEDLIKELKPFSYEFLTPSNILIRKSIVPFLFEAKNGGNPLPKEKRVQSVEWMNIDDFFNKCSYENVKEVIKELKELRC